MTSTTNQTPTLANWLLGILGTIVAAAVVGMGAMVYNKVDNVAATQSGIQKDIEWIKLGMNDIYTSKQADRDHDQIKKTTDDLYGRWRNLETRVEALENSEAGK